MIIYNKKWNIYFRCIKYGNRCLSHENISLKFCSLHFSRKETEGDIVFPAELLNFNGGVNNMKCFVQVFNFPITINLPNLQAHI